MGNELGINSKVVDAWTHYDNSGDPPVLVARAGQVRSVLGWKPRLDDLDTIVRTSLEWERMLQTAPW